MDFNFISVICIPCSDCGIWFTDSNTHVVTKGGRTMRDDVAYPTYASQTARGKGWTFSKGQAFCPHCSKRQGAVQ